jgi:hypothetical protein
MNQRRTTPEMKYRTLGRMQIELIYGMRSTIYNTRQEDGESGMAILAVFAAGGSTGM